MPRDLNGNYTLPPGNPVVTGTVIESVWANTTMADLANEVTGSLSRYGNGGMLAHLKLVDGTASVPGLGFNNETTTGLYRSDTGDIRFSLLAQDFLQLAANLLMVHDGDLVVTRTGSDGLLSIRSDNGGVGLQVLDSGSIQLTQQDATGAEEKIILGVVRDGNVTLNRNGIAQLILADGTNQFTGTVSGDDPVNDDDFVTKGYADSNYTGTEFVLKAGDTMTGPLKVHPTSTAIALELWRSGNSGFQVRTQASKAVDLYVLDDNNANGHRYLRAIHNSATYLYYNAAQKFTTAAEGSITSGLHQVTERFYTTAAATSQLKVFDWNNQGIMGWCYIDATGVVRLERGIASASHSGAGLFTVTTDFTIPTYATIPSGGSQHIQNKTSVSSSRTASKTITVQTSAGSSLGGIAFDFYLLIIG